MVSSIIQAAQQGLHSLDTRFIPAAEEVFFNPNSDLGRVVYSPKSRPVKSSIKPRVMDFLHKNFAEHESSGGTNRTVWHQHSVQNHSIAVMDAFDEWLTSSGRFDRANPRIVLDDSKARIALQEEIDGISKMDLMYYAMVYHDIGKFFPTIFPNPKTGNFVTRYGIPRFGHSAHERLGGALFTRPETSLSEEVKDLGLTEKQIKYVRSLIALHYELGKARSSLEKSGKFDLDYLGSEQCNKDLKSFYSKPVRQRFKFEIPLMFIFDSFGKVDTPPNSLIDFTKVKANSDIDEKKVRAWADKEIKQPFINRAVSGLATNLIFGKKALELANRIDEA